MVGRGVLLDVARHLGVSHLEDGIAITSEDLDATAKAQGVEVRRGDFVIVRTGQMEQRLDCGDWGGYAGGDAPGLAFETASTNSCSARRRCR
jgi:Putative cyclase